MNAADLIGIDDKQANEALLEELKKIDQKLGYQMTQGQTIFTR